MAGINASERVEKNHDISLRADKDQQNSISFEEMGDIQTSEGEQHCKQYELVRGNVVWTSEDQGAI
jgi:hypothetical protein